MRLLLLLACVCCALARAETMHFVYPPPEAAGDERHQYYWELLDAALTANREQYGDYSLTPYRTPMTFQRAVAELESGRGLINIVSRETNLELERRLLPVRIPLDKGLLGVRMFLVMPETQRRLEMAKTLSDLQKFSIGQSSSWSDVKILENAGFSLVLADNYQPLFGMLGAGRFDLFSRGVIEIEAEWRANHEKIPEMMIEKRFLLNYPMPRYFFVTQNAEGERMAARIADGLQRLRNSGEFERRYQKWKKMVLKDLQLAGRIVFRLKNTELSPETPLADKYWWDDLTTETGTPR